MLFPKMKKKLRNSKIRFFYDVTLHHSIESNSQVCFNHIDDHDTYTRIAHLMTLFIIVFFLLFIKKQYHKYDNTLQSYVIILICHNKPLKLMYPIQRVKWSMCYMQTNCRFKL